MLNTFICAEAGSNHDGKFEQALKLIDVAKEADCDAVKFQIFSSETLYAEKTPDFANYKNISKLIKKLELPKQWLPDLFEYCQSKNIEFMATPFDEDALYKLIEIGVSRIKIAAFESSDPRFVKLCAETKMPIVFSAGVSVNPFDTVHWILKENKEADITVLHCNSAYPTPPEDAMLNTIHYYNETMKSGIKVGLSDHTEGTIAPALAVIQGASFIEAHYTLDKTLDGPDHPFARTPKELKELVKNVRFAEKCVGTKFAMTDSEKRFQNATRSVVAKTTIKAGSSLSKYNVTTMRPFISGSVNASDYFNILGKKAINDIEKNNIINIKDIEE